MKAFWVLLYYGLKPLGGRAFPQNAGWTWLPSSSKAPYYVGNAPTLGLYPTHTKIEV